MAKEIELSSLDLGYEGHRMKNPGLEERLLVSIAQGGIEEPLEGVQREQANILLNGFKRYRCAHKLQLRTVPCASPGEDEVAARLGPGGQPISGLCLGKQDRTAAPLLETAAGFKPENDAGAVCQKPPTRLPLPD